MSDATSIDLALMAFRIAVGIVFLAHGEAGGAADQVCVQDGDQGRLDWDGAVLVALAAHAQDAAAVFGDAQISHIGATQLLSA